MPSRSRGRWKLFAGLSVVGFSVAAILVINFIQNGWQDYATTVLNPVSREVNAFVANQIADAVSAVQRLSPNVLPLNQPNKYKLDHAVGGFSEIEKSLWDAILINAHHSDYRPIRVIYGDAQGYYFSVREPSHGHYLVSKHSPTGNRPAFQPLKAKVIEFVPCSPSFDPRKRPWYQVANERQRTTWIPVFPDYDTKVSRQVLAKPLYRPDGTLKGVAGVDIDLVALTKKLRDALPHKDANIYLVNEIGQIIATANSPQIPSTRGTPVPLENIQSPFNARPIGLGTIGSFTSGDRPYWEIKQPVVSAGNPAWEIVLTIPESALLSLWLRDDSSKVALLLAALLLMPLIGYVLIQRQLKKVHDLKHLITLAVAEHTAEAVPIETEQHVREITKKLNHRLRNDLLTGVLNREAFASQVRSRCANMPLCDSEKFSLLFIDLNGFKEVNDVHGHHAGDQVLKITAQRMKQQLKRDDMIARFGGDEFVIYAHAMDDLEGVEAICERLHRSLSHPILLESGVSVSIGGAIGCAYFPKDGSELETLMEKADGRMYSAKRAMKQQKGDRKSEDSQPVAAATQGAEKKTDTRMHQRPATSMTFPAPEKEISGKLQLPFLGTGKKDQLWLQHSIIETTPEDEAMGTSVVSPQPYTLKQDDQGISVGM